MEGGGEKFRMEKEKGRESNPHGRREVACYQEEKGRESNRQGRKEVECYQEEEGDDEKVVRKVQRKG